MTKLTLPRRKFLTGLVGLIAAPAIVRATSLMPVKAYRRDAWLAQYLSYPVSDGVILDDVACHRYAEEMRRLGIDVAF
jgi:hypothetical protein